MTTNFRALLIVNLIASTIVWAPSIQASTKKFLEEVGALGLAEEKELVHQALILIREYCNYDTEYTNNCHMPDNIKQEILDKIQQKREEISALFIAHQSNTCFITKMTQVLKALDLQSLKAKLKGVEALLAELNKK